MAVHEVAEAADFLLLVDFITSDFNTTLKAHLGVVVHQLLLRGLGHGGHGFLVELEDFVLGLDRLA